MKLRIIDAYGKESILEAEEHQNLLRILKNNGYALDAPCGGNGSCHKCRITVDGTERLACATEAKDGMTVELPRLEGVRVLAGGSLLNKMRYSLRISNAYGEGRGLAVDLGTTTVALLIFSLRNGRIIAEASGENLQKAFGADVISRIIEQGKEGGAARLNAAAMESISRILPKEATSIRRVAIAGNTTMEYLLLGRDAACIRKNEPDPLEFHDLHMSDLLNPDGSAPPDQLNLKGDSVSDRLNLKGDSAFDNLSSEENSVLNGPNFQGDSGIDNLSSEENSVLNGPNFQGDSGIDNLSSEENSVSDEQEPRGSFPSDNVLQEAAGWNTRPEAELLLMPNVGSYVGGDITAGVFASDLWKNESMGLFVDLGTNGEIVFGNSEFMLCCACSAGPAFEGGDTACGMRAMDGAIDSVRIDPVTYEPSFTVLGAVNDAVDTGHAASCSEHTAVGTAHSADYNSRNAEFCSPKGICGSGIIDLTAELFKNKIITPKGRFCVENAHIRKDEFGVRRYCLTDEVYITETDLDNIIRAKGAIFAGISVMLSSLEMDVSAIGDIYVAGGVGSAINMKNATAIGMLPDISEEHLHFLGNASLAGAYAAAVSDDARRKIYELAHGMTYLDLSTIPCYMDCFTGECFIPHTTVGTDPTIPG